MNWPLLVKQIIDFYPNYTIETIGELTLDQLYVLVTPEEALKVRPGQKFVTGSPSQFGFDGADLPEGAMTIEDLILGRDSRDTMNRQERRRRKREARMQLAAQRAGESG